MRECISRQPSIHIITKPKLKEFWQLHKDSEASLLAWYNFTRKATWGSLAEVRADFPHADLVGACTVFNIKGNSYRLITKIYYEQQTVLLRFVLTHSEYDEEKWKYDCGK